MQVKLLAIEPDADEPPSQGPASKGVSHRPTYGPTQDVRSRSTASESV